MSTDKEEKHMQIKNGRIVEEKVMSDDELILRRKLKTELENSFGLQLNDIPNLMKKIGIRSQNYQILPSYYFYDGQEYIVKTKNTEYLVEIFRGNMINHYSHIKVTNKGKNKYYSVKKVIQVERFE